MYQLLSVIALVYVTSGAGQMCQNQGKQVSSPGQMCQNQGKQCFAHSDCCGGCCVRQICVESNRNCQMNIDDCEVFYCPPGLSCSLFQLPGCPGCPIVKFCKEEDQHIAGEWS